MESKEKLRPSTIATRLQQELGRRPHVEIAIKPEDAKQYCRKPDSRLEGPWEYGHCTTGQGTYTSLAGHYICQNVCVLRCRATFRFN